MVKLPIWLQAGMIYDGGMLCIGCLETRIGRQLTRSDFDMDLPINTLQEGPFSTRSDRLKNRLKSMHTNYSSFMPNSSISSDYDVIRKRIKSNYPKILAYLAK